MGCSFVGNDENSTDEERTGTDCYADDRDALNDFAKYFNNEHLSDVALQVGDKRFAAHKIILCRSSEVFDRMLSKRWSKQGYQELELSEDAPCTDVFDNFLRFLYSNNVVLKESNVLPLLILADKYSVHGLRKVCVDFAVRRVLPSVNLKTLIHVWFKYATTAYHPASSSSDLSRECVAKISKHFKSIISDPEWEEDWLSLDRDQLTELLKSNDLVLQSEYSLWAAVERWFNDPKSPQRRAPTSSALAAQVLSLIRFPSMTADELAEVEGSSLAKEHQKTIMPLTHLAFKYISMSLASRMTHEFTGLSFLLREYLDVRWDSKAKLKLKDLENKHQDLRINIMTRASTFPYQQWDWELIFSRNLSLGPTYSSLGSRASEEFSIELKSVDLDQQRSVEYMLMFTNEKETVRRFAGKKTFTKSRTTACLEMDVGLTQLLETTPGLVQNGELNLQLMLRPIV
ncbi:BTB/POZ domain-containing protein 17 [Aphelenchoides fujianensis]|nr:BTB/POZ domain-containing protein 17 [Aphelenchoides fujianensis]